LDRLFFVWIFHHFLWNKFNCETWEITIQPETSLGPAVSKKTPQELTDLGNKVENYTQLLPQLANLCFPGLSLGHGYGVAA